MFNVNISLPREKRCNGQSSLMKFDACSEEAKNRSYFKAGASGRRRRTLTRASGQ